MLAYIVVITRIIT